MNDDAVPNLFDGEDPPPRDEYVLAQGFWRKPSYCKRVLPDERMWPIELERASKDSEDRVWIDRKILFEVAQRVVAEPVEPRAAMQLHAAIAFWGAPSGQPTIRAMRPLAQDQAAVRFAEAIRVVRGEGPASTFKALSRYQRLWISGLGPSYFTKLMYFAGYAAKPHTSQPLIMDDNVVGGLTKVTEQRWQATQEDYLRYIDLAKDWAYALDTDPDVIERRLFEIGS